MMEEKNEFQKIISRTLLNLLLLLATFNLKKTLVLIRFKTIELLWIIKQRARRLLNIGIPIFGIAFVLPKIFFRIIANWGELTWGKLANLMSNTDTKMMEAS